MLLGEIDESSNLLPVGASAGGIVGVAIVDDITILRKIYISTCLE